MSVVKLAEPKTDKFVVVTVLLTTKFEKIGVPDILTVVRFAVPAQFILPIVAKLEKYTFPITSNSVSLKVFPSKLFTRIVPSPMIRKAG